MPCNAHVQQSIVQDVYVIDIKEPKPIKDGRGFKLSSGSRWPNGDLLLDAEKTDLRNLREKLVDKSNDLYEKLMSVGVLDCYNSAGEFFGILCL